MPRENGKVAGSPTSQSAEAGPFLGTGVFARLYHKGPHIANTMSRLAPNGPRKSFGDDDQQEPFLESGRASQEDDIELDELEACSVVMNRSEVNSFVIGRQRRHSNSTSLAHLMPSSA